jgi:hypothetical protein
MLGCSTPSYKMVFVFACNLHIPHILQIISTLQTILNTIQIAAILYCLGNNDKKRMSARIQLRCNIFPSIFNPWWMDPPVWIHLIQKTLSIYICSKAMAIFYIKNTFFSWVTVADTCNPRYSEGRDQGNHSLRSTPGKMTTRPYLKNTQKKKKKG